MADFEVHIDLNGRTRQVGLARSNRVRGKETVLFEYADAWLDDPVRFSLQRGLPKSTAWPAPSSMTTSAARSPYDGNHPLWLRSKTRFPDACAMCSPSIPPPGNRNSDCTPWRIMSPQSGWEDSRVRAAGERVRETRRRISDANSILGVLRSSSLNASFVRALSPQWKSWAGHWKSDRPMRVRTGLPIHRCFHGIAPGSIVPPPDGRRHPMTRSAPPESFSTNGLIREKS